MQAVAALSGCQVLVGSSSAGEFTDRDSGTGWASALGLSSKSKVFSFGIGEGMADDSTGAARYVVSGFTRMKVRPYPFCSALVMTDAPAGHAYQVVEEITIATGGSYSFFSGGAGDDGKFSRTHVFAGTRALTNAVVAREIQSLKPIGIGVSQGLQPAGPALRVIESHGATIVSFNDAPARHAFEDHAESLGVSFDATDPMPFMLHNVLGIVDWGRYRLRVPLAILHDGWVACVAPGAEGSVVRFMHTKAESAVSVAEQAAHAALVPIGEAKSGGVLVFDCVGIRMRIGQGFDDELGACASILKPATFAGCNTYGQIARAEGQFGGFHNCVAVVCVIAESDMNWSRLQELFLALSEEKCRAQAARGLVLHLRADQVLLYALDPVSGVLIPVPGMAKTIRGGSLWRKFLASLTMDGWHEQLVDSPQGEQRQELAYFGRGSALAMIGGVLQPTLLSEVEYLSPLLGLTLKAEQRLMAAEAGAPSAADEANRANALTVALDRARFDASMLNAQLRADDLANVKF